MIAMGGGVAEVQQGFGDAENEVRPILFIQQRCARLIEMLPVSQHAPNRPEEAIKVDAEEEGVGGAVAADGLR